MSGLFSHPGEPPQDAVDRPALHAEVTVPAPRDHAWAGLTEHLHLWWPAGELSRWGDESFFDLEDNALVETSAQDDENVWGEVTDGLPGEWLSLTWRHAGSQSVTQLLLVMGQDQTGVGDVDRLPPRGRGVADTGEADTGGAAVGEPRSVLTITHSGWTGTDPEDLYAFYRTFWPEALGCYRRFMGGS